MPADLAAVATQIREILTERGPLSEKELLDTLILANAPMGDDPAAFFDLLMSSDDLGPVGFLVDDRCAWLPAGSSRLSLSWRISSMRRPSCRCGRRPA